MDFQSRHIGIRQHEIDKMLQTVNAQSIDELIDQTIPSNILNRKPLSIPNAISEFEFLKEIETIGNKNIACKSYIGQGFYGTITPSPILRNIFQNPGWYTQYTPYQAEISQGRLEALLNFQTMVSEITALPIANASLLDEASAASEALNVMLNVTTKKGITKPAFFVSKNCFQSTIDVVMSRATAIGVEVIIGDENADIYEDNIIGALLQYPNKNGEIQDYKGLIESLHNRQILVAMACDILSLALLTPPGELGADFAIGNTQRLGVPMGFGGPHAAYFACKDEFKRNIPGRIIGVSVDVHNNRALRMALQTREQHIRREKATSNICTAQALLAIMASMYAVYHGNEGIKKIAEQIHYKTNFVAVQLTNLGYSIENKHWFDTLSVETDETTAVQIRTLAESNHINFYYTNNHIRLSIDETTSEADLQILVQIFALAKNNIESLEIYLSNVYTIPNYLQRKSTILQHSVFSKYHSETELMRYIKKLENKDLSLVHAMIPLGSCTMKLNSATSLMPVNAPPFATIHPYAPIYQTKGYQQIISELEEYLSVCTGFTACSLQPNSGAQGELAGLLCIKQYHTDRNDSKRDVALIPSSAHGTNPASAVMAGMRVIVVECDSYGNIKIEDLAMKAEMYKDNLACLMVTYPSTHGVFEEKIKEICAVIHQFGGLVYMDGANMNAQIGLTSPGYIGADVCHLNLHKTFSIPHGGGGPGVGPICVNEKLAPYLPKHAQQKVGGEKGILPVSAAPWGSASILLIPYAYIKMLGAEGLRKSTEIAILNANYIKSKLEKYYTVLYVGKGYGRVAHELIIDLRAYKSLGIEAEDVAKRLLDYGFHAPTLSFPVAGTIMIEPTESEPLSELDRFCSAMIAIKNEIDEIANGKYTRESNVLKNAPHSYKVITADEWQYTYTREKAAFPLSSIRENKFWINVSRLNNSFGDRNLVCTCPPLEAYAE